MMIISKGIKRHSVIPAVYLVFERDGKLLLLKRANTGYMDGYYGLPSGHIESGESASVAGVREALEEVGVEVDPKDLVPIHVSHRQSEEGDHERIDVYFRVRKWEGEPKNAEPHKCSELLWASNDNLPDNIVPVMGAALKHASKGKFYSEAF